MTTHYRADQIGSFIRPDDLRRARIDRIHGRITPEQLRGIEDKAILNILDIQKKAGLDVFSDGEYRRSRFTSNLPESVEGVTLNKGDRARAPSITDVQYEENPELIGPEVAATGKVRTKKRQTAEEIDFLKKHSPGPFKVTVPSAWGPARTWFKLGISDKVYRDRQELLNDIVIVVQSEMRAAVADGTHYVQLDVPGYTQFMDPVQRQRLVADGLDPDQEMERAIAADNACLRVAKKPGVTVGLHVCRGTYVLGGGGAVGSRSSYDPIAEKLFNALEADTLTLEYTERAGGFESLRFVPKDKVAVIGIMSIRDPQLESLDYLLRRIDEAAKYVPVERLAVSPQCGFSGMAPMSWMTWDDQLRKLDRLVELRHKVWGHS